METNSPVGSRYFAGGEDSRMGGPRHASVEVGSTKPSLEFTPCDRRVCWNLVVGGTKWGSVSEPEERRVRRVSTRRRCIVVHLNFVLEGYGGRGRWWRRGRRRAREGPRRRARQGPQSSTFTRSRSTRRGIGSRQPGQEEPWIRPNRPDLGKTGQEKPRIRPRRNGSNTRGLELLCPLSNSIRTY
jgi:hypothetical protein